MKDAMKVQNSNIIVDLPAQVVAHLPGMKQEWNSGGGSCLFKAAAGHVNEFALNNNKVTYQELRVHVHKKLVEWWDKFEMHFGWPFEVTVGAGNNSRTKFIENPSEYFQFLQSAESLDSYSESEIDLWLLSYVLDTTVWTLSYNLPVGQGTDGSRCRWKSFPGQGISKEETKFSCKPEPLYMLNEHLSHWTRIIAEEDTNKLGDESLAAQKDPPPRKRSGEEEALGLKNKVNKRSKKSNTQETSTNNIETLIGSESRHAKPRGSNSKVRASKKMEGDGRQSGDLAFSVKTVSGVIMDLGDTNLDMEVDKYQTFVVNETDAKEEASISSSEKERIDRELSDWRKVSALGRMNVDKKKKLNQEKLRRIKEIQEIFSELKLKKLFKNNLTYIQNIHDGSEYSQRYEDFEKGGLVRSALRHMVISDPFKSNQLEVIKAEIHKMLGASTQQEKFDQSDYVWKVLLPETVIKVRIAVLNIK